MKEVAVNNQGIGSWTARRARKTPGRTALIHEERAVSYADLHDRSTRLAHALRALGIASGDRVAFLGPNHPSFLLTLFACGQLGAVFLPLNTRLTPAELRYQVEHSGAHPAVRTQRSRRTARRTSHRGRTAGVPRPAAGESGRVD
ncbi:MAG TPA: AMP-binding protein [Streptosporangiaceae bacterium]